MPFRKKFKNQKYLNELSEIEHQFDSKDILSDGKVEAKEITIFGDIGNFWWDSISAKDVRAVLNEDDEADIIVNLNSPGGDVFEGIAIYNSLKNHKGYVTINVVGWAASAASIIAMAGDKINMQTGAMMMIHEAWTFAMGSKREIGSTLNALETIDSSLADIYMMRFKGERSEVEAFIENETWFTAAETIAVGFADGEVEAEEDDPEEFKNSVIARFVTKDQKSNIYDKAKELGNTTKVTAIVASGILSKFKRP